MGMSTKKALAYAPLELAMRQSLQEKYGVKIRVFSPIGLLKSAFYSLKKTDEDFKNISLLSTASPEILLIYNSQGESDNGTE